MNCSDAAIALQPDSSTRSSLARDGHAALAKRRKVAEQRSAAHLELLGELTDGRGFSAPEQISKLHQSISARHLW